MKYRYYTCDVFTENRFGGNGDNIPSEEQPDSFRIGAAWDDIEIKIL